MLRFVIPILLALSVIWLSGCSPTAPVSGTETGNPAIITCAVSALDQLNSPYQWSPSFYLPGGEEQLNPEYVRSQPVPLKVAKKKSELSGAESGDSYIIIRVDTIVMIDTVYVRDTIVKSYVGMDTILNDNSTIHSQYQYNDSLFISDTLVVYDTFLIEHRDTLQLGSEPSGVHDGKYTSFPLKSVLVTSLYNSDTVIVRLERENAPATEVVLDYDKYYLHSDSSLKWLRRETTVSGVSISEEYSDGDGDGLLYFAGGAALPSFRLEATYSQAEVIGELRVHFDAGADMNHWVCSDNRIRALKRTLSQHQKLIEDVAYGPEYVQAGSDSVYLIVTNSSVADTVTNSHTRYACLFGDDKLDHRQNKLAGLSYSANFRYGVMQRMNYSICFDTLVHAGETPHTAKIEAYFDFGKGRSAYLDGKIDYQLKILSGSYAENGVEYIISYDHSTGSLTREKVE